MEAKPKRQHQQLRLPRCRACNRVLPAAYKIKPHEYVDGPRLSEEMLSRMVVKRRGRPITGNARRLLTLRLPVEVIERWKATGPGWQTRMAERLSKTR